MKDWIAYIKERVDCDLWGFIVLDYYHHKKGQGYKGSPSQFIDEVVKELPNDVGDIVLFHNTLLSVCVDLLGVDFSDIMGKSISFLKRSGAPPSGQQLESIIKQYETYGKHDVFRARIAAADLNIAKKGIEPSKARRKEDPAVEENKKAKAASPASSEFLHEKMPPGTMKEPFKHTHMLRYYSRSGDLVERKPFQGKRVFFILHFLKDLVPFVKAAQELGLDMTKSYFYYKDYPYPQREAIARWLSDEHAEVESREDIRGHLEELANGSQDNMEGILLIEDGGFLVPAIHRDFPQLLPHVIGAVEQTSRGIRNVEQLGELRLPVISVATSELKRAYEPPYIATAVVDNLRRMVPDITVRGKKVALFGYGTIGSEIAQWLRLNGADLTLFDKDAKNKLLGTDRGFTFADSPAQAAQNKLFVIGASGEETINSEVIAALSHGSYVLSASSELYEVDVEELEKQQIEMRDLPDDTGKCIGRDFALPPNNRIVHLLANGYPINFWGFESMPNQASDLILSLILLCAAELALGNYAVPGIDADAVNKIAKKYKLAEKFLEFHRQG